MPNIDLVIVLNVMSLGDMLRSYGKPVNGMTPKEAYKEYLANLDDIERTTTAEGTTVVRQVYDHKHFTRWLNKSGLEQPADKYSPEWQKLRATWASLRWQELHPERK